ncbi:hypothetical protein HDU85_003600, partial [Gaertneriomyces sp. JEL0708]
FINSRWKRTYRLVPPLNADGYPPQYQKLIQHIKAVQGGDDNGRYATTHWAIIDTSDTDIFGSVPEEVAESFNELLEDTFGNERICKQTPTAQFLLNGIQEECDIAELGLIVQATGVQGLLDRFLNCKDEALEAESPSLPGGTAVMAAHLVRDGLDCLDNDAGYIGSCLIKTRKFLQTFSSGMVPNERILDMKLLGELADPPKLTLI